MSKQEELRLSDKEMALLKAYADEMGMSVEEAASQLTHDAIAKRFRKNLGRGPAKVYSIKRNKE